MAKHTHVVITFTQGGQLRFVDPRTFGEMFVATPDELTERGRPSWPTLGVDPVDEPDLVGRLRPPAAAPRDEAQGVPHRPVDHRRHRQHLHRRDPLRRRACATTARPTRSRPRRSAGSTGRWSRPSTTPSSTAARPSADEQYVDLHGKPGEYQEHHQVYDREKQPCRRCRRHDIVKAKFAAAAPPIFCGPVCHRSSRPRPGPCRSAVFLKTLTLKGFKSFADTTTLELEPGVTVVVGPNGSGKSNVVDAIGWVLGAQAPSAVRSPEDGRRHLRRHRQAPGARPGRGRPHHRQQRRAAARSSSPRSPSPARCSAPATASTPSTACRAGCSTSRSCSPTPASAASST